MTEAVHIRIARRVRSTLRWVAAVLSCELTWLVASEGLRERAPAGLVAWLLGPWTAIVWSWQLLLPDEPATPVALGGLMLAADLCADAWIPYRARFGQPSWELLRMLCVGLAWVLRDTLRARHSVSRAVRGTSIAMVAAFFASVALVVRESRIDQTRPADVALVLGFALDEHGQPQPSLTARLEHGVDLYRRGLVRVLVLSGGAVHGTRTESDAMYRMARQSGVPASALIEEPLSRSTVENIYRSRELLGREPRRVILLVTEPFHMARARLVARRAGLLVYASPASSPAWRSPRAASYWIFREAGLYPVEWLRGLVTHGTQHASRNPA